MRHDSGDLIWSPEGGGRCPTCQQALARCTCRGSSKPGAKRRASKGAAPDAPPADGVVRVSRQTKGRKGKGMTLVTGLPLSEAELATLAKQLKRRCGTGGTAKDGVIEIQGDQREVVLAELLARGFPAKLAGG